MFISATTIGPDADVVRHLREGPNGVAEWNAWLGKQKGGVTLDKIDLSGLEMPKVVFAGCSLLTVNLDRATLVGANFSSTNIECVSLRGAVLDMANLNGARLLGTDLWAASCFETNFDGATLSGVKLDGANCSGASFLGAKCDGEMLEGHHYKPLSAIAADVRGANFVQARLNGANFSGAFADGFTRFNKARVEGCTVDRYFLESLRDECGIDKADRLTMNIVDGVATLRMSYSGFLAWVHGIALVAFLFPYVWFAIRQYTVARFMRDDANNAIPLWRAIGQFVWTGGEHWEAGKFNAFPFFLALFCVAYNVLRGVLLWKTKTLELREEARSLPVQFSLTGNWGKAFAAAKYGFLLNLLVIGFHSAHFLTQRVPLPAG